MKFQNSFKIALSNYGLVFKTLLYKIVTFLLLGVILGLILRIRLRDLVNSFSPVVSTFLSTLKNVFGGSEIIEESLHDVFGHFMEYLFANISSIMLTVLIFVLFLYLFSFFSGIGDCVVTIQIDRYAGSMTKGSYIGTFLENIKRIVIYQLMDSLIYLIYHILMLGLIYLMFVLLVSKMSIVVAVFSMILLSFAKAVFMTLRGSFMTSCLLDKKPVSQTVASGFKDLKSVFWKIVVVYLSLTIIEVYLYVSVTIFTVGAGTFLLLGFSAVLYASVRVVDYYVVRKKKYYVDFDTIVVPKELRGNDENLLNDMEI